MINTEFFEPSADAGSLVTTTFIAEGNKTRMVVTSAYPSVAIRDMVLATGMERGAAIGYDRIEERAMTIDSLFLGVGWFCGISRYYS